jgi:hypothetical protein
MVADKGNGLESLGHWQILPVDSLQVVPEVEDGTTSA